MMPAASLRDATELGCQFVEYVVQVGEDEAAQPEPDATRRVRQMFGLRAHTQLTRLLLRPLKHQPNALDAQSQPLAMGPLLVRTHVLTKLI